MGNCPCFINVSEIAPEEQNEEERRRSEYHSKLTHEDLGLLGISVHYLSNQFLAELKSAGLHEFSRVYDIENTRNFDQLGIIRKKGANVKCPIDKRVGAAYVHSITDMNDVGRADIMLSYAWAYSIGDIIDTLVGYCKGSKRDPKQTFVWMCCLCDNQHRIAESKRLGEVVPVDEFRTAYFGRVKEIGHILTMMIPWQASTYFTRVCCVFELFMASANGCSITLGMPRKERNEFMDAMRSDDGIKQVKDFFALLSQIDVKEAKASEEDDLRNIQYLIENGVGYEAFNVRSRSQIQKCVVDFIESEVVKEKLKLVDTNSKKRQGNLLNNVAGVFRLVGEYDRCMTICQEALRTNEAVHGQNSKEAARTIEIIGGALYFQGHKDEAIQLHESALVIRKKELGKNHEDTAASMEWVAFILTDKGETEQALEMHKDVLEIRKNVFGWEHEKTAGTLNFIAALLKEKGEKEEALRLYKEALEIIEKVLGWEHKETSATMFTIANTLYESGELKESLKMFEESYKIEAALYGSQHPQAVHIREWITNVSCEIGMG